MKKIAYLLFLFLPCTAQLQAQALPADSLFDRLIGDWVMKGVIAGDSTIHDVTFSRMLGRGYVQMHEVSREREKDGSPVYEAFVFFGRDPKTGEYAVIWLDNTGTSAFEPIGHGYVVGDSVAFVWELSPTDRIHNTFQYHGDSDSWEWRIDNEKEGVRSSFARVKLKRK